MQINPSQELGNYKDLLKSFLQNEYEFIFFDELSKKNGQVILRHDIDFDVNAALETAKIEHELGISAIYFFMMRSKSYNLFNNENFEQVLQIKELGHKISIHFDPTIYQNYVEGFELEKKIFQLLFNQQIDIISLHRPNKFFQTFDSPISGCDHTYMTKYFKKIGYISDSTGIFRFGHPLQSNEFLRKESIHLLIHPIWWVIQGKSNYDKLKSFFELKKENLKNHYGDNCLPFKEIKNEI